MTNGERLAEAEKSKVEGNALFKAGKLTDALEKYNECIDYADMTDEPASVELLSTGRLNYALVSIRLGEN